MSDTPDYGRYFSQWCKACPDEWHCYTHHDFVEKLHDGSLPKEAFLHYLKQDYVFLVHFSRAWALAVVKSSDEQEMRLASAIVHVILHQEMQLHIGLCAKEGIDEATLFSTPEAPGNLAYTRYVLEAGYSGGFLDLIAALAPCALGYGAIGARLGAKNSTTPYQKWIDTYADEGYQQLCRDLGQLIDRAIDMRLGSQAEKTGTFVALTERFRTATQLEIGFWDMGLSP